MTCILLYLKIILCGVSFWLSIGFGTMILLMLFVIWIVTNSIGPPEEDDE